MRSGFEDGDALHRLQVDATRCRASAEVGEFDDLAKRLKEQIAKRGQLTDGRDVTEPFDHPRFEVDQLANLRQKCEIPSAPSFRSRARSRRRGTKSERSGNVMDRSVNSSRPSSSAIEAGPSSAPRCRVGQRLEPSHNADVELRLCLPDDEVVEIVGKMVKPIERGERVIERVSSEPTQAGEVAKEIEVGDRPVVRPAGTQPDSGLVGHPLREPSEVVVGEKTLELNRGYRRAEWTNHLVGQRRRDIAPLILRRRIAFDEDVLRSGPSHNRRPNSWTPWTDTRCHRDPIRGGRQRRPRLLRWPQRALARHCGWRLLQSTDRWEAGRLPSRADPDERDGRSRRRRFSVPKHSPARETTVRQRNRPEVAREQLAASARNKRERSLSHWGEGEVRADDA